MKKNSVQRTEVKTRTSKLVVMSPMKNLVDERGQTDVQPEKKLEQLVNLW